jgi:hypothetical protein
VFRWHLRLNCCSLERDVRDRQQPRGELMG